MKRWIQGHKRKLQYVCSLILIVGLLFGVMMIPVIEQNQFDAVVEYVNNDSRNPSPITYACPNCTSKTGWSVAHWKWGRNVFIDWNQVEYFLNELEWYNKTVYRCDYYRTHPDEGPWRLFLWFQTGEYRYVFLCTSDSF